MSTVKIEKNRQMPNAVDIERQLLSDILFDSQILPDVEAILTKEAFYDDRNKDIYSAILDLSKNSAPINQLTVTQKLKKQNSCAVKDGIGYIVELATNGKLNHTSTYDSLLIHQEYIKREAILKSAEIAEKAFENNSELDEIIEKIDNLTTSFDKLLNCGVQNIIAESEIKADEQINYEPHFLSFKNDKFIGIFSKNSMSVVMGKAKSRKTFATTCLASYLVGGLQDGYVWAKKISILHYDTEQSRFFSQMIIKRIETLTHQKKCENYRLFAIKRYDIHERKKIIETSIKIFKPDMIIIDGVRDLLLDFNDLRESTSLINWLLMLQDKYNIHIQCIVHVNKADTNARGHLGAELMNKCETAIIVEKSDNNQSIIRPCETRGESFKPMILSIENGIPYITGFAEENEISQRKPF